MERNRKMKWTLLSLFSIFQVMTLAGQGLEKSYEEIKLIRFDVFVGTEINLLRTPDQRLEIAREVLGENRSAYRTERMGDTLLITEEGIRIEGSMQNNNACWSLKLPDQARVEINGSGCRLNCIDIRTTLDVDVTLLKASIRGGKMDADISMTRGKVECSNSQGSFDVSGALANLRFTDCKAALSLSTAKGDIRCQNIELNGNSSLSSTSGDCSLSLSASPEYNLKIRTTTSRAILDMNGHPLKSKLELLASKKKGKIVSAIPADQQEEIVGRSGLSKNPVENPMEIPFLRQVTNPEISEPLIYMKTESGKLRVRL